MNKFKGEAFLFHFASIGNLKSFQQYFEDGNININWKSSIFEETPFFVASKNGRLEIVEYMLASQRELNILSKDHKRISPVEIAKINSELQEKLEYENEENEIKQRQANCLSIYNLLQEYQSNLKGVKSQLRKKLKLKGLNFHLFQ